MKTTPSRILQPKILLIALISILGFLSNSCQKEPGDEAVTPRSRSLSTTSEENNEGRITLLEHHENPYRISVMRRVWDSLNADLEFNSYTEYPRATHKYVVFKTDTWAEFNKLMEDTNTEFSDYPLEYEVSDGDWYHGNETPLDSPTYQYAIVALDYSCPTGVDMNEIGELYIPDKDPVANPSWFQSDALDALEQTAYVITGNEDELVPLDSSVTGRRPWWQPRDRWHPRGTVKYKDESLNSGTDVAVPLATIRIRTRFGAYSIKTDVKGNFYSQHSTWKKIRYELQWEGPYWDIRRGTFGQAKDKTDRKTEPHDFYYTGGIHKAYCIAQVAAYDYHFVFAPNNQLEPPPRVGISKLKIAVQVNHWVWFSRENGGRFQYPDLIRSADIILGMDVNQIPSKHYYSVAMHELGHATHWDFSGNHYHFRQSCIQLQESWAEFVQWLSTKQKYGTYGDPSNYNDNCQQRDRYYVNSEDEQQWQRYTSFLIGMYDSKEANNRILYNNQLLVFDEIYGYTPLQIETGVRYTRDFDSFVNFMVTNYDNPTEDDLMEMRQYWQNPGCEDDVFDNTNSSCLGN